jgi:hypothetical protein
MKPRSNTAWLLSEVGRPRGAGFGTAPHVASSEAQPQANGGDLRLEQVLIQRGKALPDRVATDAEVVEDVGET